MPSATESPFSVADFFARGLRLLEVAQGVAEALERDRNADSGFRRVENDEHRGRAFFHLGDDVVLEDDLGDAAASAAFEKRGVADILAVDLEAEACRQEHAE